MHTMYAEVNLESDMSIRVDVKVYQQLHGVQLSPAHLGCVFRVFIGNPPPAQGVEGLVVSLFELHSHVGHGTTA